MQNIAIEKNAKSKTMELVLVFRGSLASVLIREFQKFHKKISQFEIFRLHPARAV